MFCARPLCRSRQRISSFIVSYPKKGGKIIRVALISRDRGEVITIRSRKTEACSEGSAYLEEGAAASGHVDRNSYLTYSLSFSFSTIFLPVLFTHNARPKINKENLSFRKPGAHRDSTGDAPNCSFEFSIMDNRAPFIFH